MPPAVPTPVAAALGLVPTALTKARRIPGKAVQLPILAVSQALTTADKVRREYDELAERGERLIGRLRGTSFDELEDKVEDAVARTPLAGTYDKVEDALEDAADRVRGLGQTARKAAPASSLADDLQGELDLTPDPEEPKGVPTPKATQPDTKRVDTAASADVVAVVEQVSAAVGTDVPAHAELPLADYDHMTLGSLRGRLRSLTLPELVQVRDYEKSKADRLPVVTMLDNRIAKLAQDASAAPKSVPTTEPAPEQQASAKAAKKAAKKSGKVKAAAAAKTDPTTSRTKVRIT